MPKHVHVKADGPLDARIVIVAEAPATYEVSIGKPLVGPSGHILWNTLCRQVGLRRQDFHILNVMEYQAPGSKIKNAYRDEVEMWADWLHPRIARTTDPWLIVPMGDIALRALLREPLWSNNAPKITQWRSSIMQYTFDDERTCKMIPTPHPAALFANWSGLYKLCLADWQRIASESRFRDLRLPKRTHLVGGHKGTKHWIKDYLDMSRNSALTCAVDIETNPASGTILCVGFAFYPEESLTLPWAEFQHEIRALCESPCTKVGQNFLYDRYWLRHKAGIELGGEIHDIMSMHHVLDCTLPHSLAVMASLDTRQPYWKQSAKDFDIDATERTPMEALCIYNGIDCCVTIELFEVYLARLQGHRAISWSMAQAREAAAA